MRIDSPPSRGRRAKVRVAPMLTIATMVSSRRPRPMVSPCQATLSVPSRYWHRPTVVNGSPSSSVYSPLRRSQMVSSTGCGGGPEVRSWKLTRRGTSRVRSYMRRRSARQGTCVSSWPMRLSARPSHSWCTSSQAPPASSRRGTGGAPNSDA
ncbi:Uncharacterised protein [Mycobacteroides abscessus subsp. abscessus]|nr:Uncharacterised protein [Mycobacteroides abscessus subsp. abscessus]